MGLPLATSCTATYTCVDKLIKLVKIIPCMVGDGGLLASATENCSLTMLFAFMRCLRWRFMIGTLDSLAAFGQHTLSCWATV